jgi:hypothetical protein
MNVLTIELPVEGLPSPTEFPGDFADEVRFLLAASRAEVPVVDLTEDELAS